MPPSICRIRIPRKRMKTTLSPLLALLQLGFFFDLSYFIFCHDLQHYVEDGPFSALKDFLLMYTYSSAFIASIWFACSIYPYTSFGKDRRIRRIKRFAGQVHSNYNRFDVATRRYMHIASPSYAGFKGVGFWAAAVFGHDAEDQPHLLGEAFEYGISTGQALLELEDRLQALAMNHE
ncbi:hypothetical protein EJ02DRAFT_258031 [Clathrospora elynae]|uniref:Uncharacterized protein n=1 Tax=Clathrospora elynae TaxID=706981 RepID=A0A6A5SIH5_9PLEO|nr:hypothetical protein EJ02DRAFT_258031 [Clathrospora elynae]